MPGEPAKRRGRHISPIRVVRRPAAAAALIGGLVVAGGSAAGLAAASQTGHPAVPVGQPTLIPVPLGRQAPAPQPSPRQVPEPVSLIIPSIGVRTGLVHLGVTSSGALQVPATAAVAGWYTGSARPGAVGAAVIAGHIDSVSGPGVFFRLRLLRRGARVYVRRADGSLAVFEVTVVHSYLKSRFPTVAVYGPVPDAELRLVTCGGTFDYATGHYLSNVIVYADLVQ
jgi:sortase (surface protein transpeptidase)